uniref:USP domain-containing protein n=1 Tax=Lactuca sativa TaxID=4236 RepID=A0A9R1V283_LACSA|nr:hypothetical protein LSAT_V11C700351310 [Lactuca sativa]
MTLLIVLIHCADKWKTSISWMLISVSGIFIPCIGIKFGYQILGICKIMTYLFIVYLGNVLVYNGGVHGGHYYAFIRPTLSDKWFKFDDERVFT